MTNQTDVVLRTADATDIAGIEQLLVASNLPTVDIADARCSFIVAEHDQQIVGVVGLEVCCDQYALLRSTAVAEAWRGHGVGRRLVERAIAEAEVRGFRALYLLTTTAEGYFPSFGFVPTTRDDVPAPVRNTTEFKEACPASASVMTLCLTA